MDEGNKYNEAEIIIGTLFLLGVDGLCFILDLTVVGTFISRVVKWASQAGMLWLANSKGDKNALKMGRVLAKFALNAVPFLPTLTTIFLIETYLHNHPKIAEVAAGKIGPTAK